MAQATVKTVQYIDHRIEPQPDPVYDYVIGPTQNQYYKIPASAKSNSSIVFNNLTTLGVDRAYGDTFEVEVGAKFTFVYDSPIEVGEDDVMPPFLPEFDCLTFDSFPLSKCTEQIHVNINGGAFFSEPLSYLRAKERYMNQKKLNDCYENVCPVNKPISQTESGKSYDTALKREYARELNLPTSILPVSGGKYAITKSAGFPTRYARGMNNFMQTATGLGSFNNSILTQIFANKILYYNI